MSSITIHGITFQSKPVDLTKYVYPDCDCSEYYICPRNYSVDNIDCPENEFIYLKPNQTGPKICLCKSTTGVSYCGREIECSKINAGKECEEAFSKKSPFKYVMATTTQESGGAITCYYKINLDDINSSNINEWTNVFGSNSPGYLDMCIQLSVKNPHNTACASNVTLPKKKHSIDIGLIIGIIIAVIIIAIIIIVVIYYVKHKKKKIPKI